MHVVIPAMCSAMCFAEDNSSWGAEMEQAHQRGCSVVSCSVVSGSLARTAATGPPSQRGGGQHYAFFHTGHQV